MGPNLVGLVYFYEEEETPGVLSSHLCTEERPCEKVATCKPEIEWIKDMKRDFTKGPQMSVKHTK